ncbi:MAG TPA: hypothetical protein VGM73_12230 [Candidatus Didemnitutus sp.]|jgi:colicin import membrane protein
MNKIYILVPLIALLIFGGFYYNFEKNFEAHVAERKAAEEKATKERVAAENATREKAFQDAIKAAEARKIEREKIAKLKEKKKQDRLDAEDHRQHTFDERNRLRDQVKRQKNDLDVVKAEIAKLDEQKAQSTKELTFLHEFVTKAESNQKYYYDLLDRIAAADAARAAAEAAAAAAAAKAKS